MSRHVWTSISGWGSRLLVALSQLLVIRILTDSLGMEEYAVFAIMAGIAGWFALADFGLGTGLQNTVSELRANKVDYTQFLRRLAPSVAAMFVLSASISAALAFVVGPVLFRNFPAVPHNQQIACFLATSVLLTGTAIGSIAYKLWIAEGRGYAGNIAQGVGAAFGLAAVYAVSTSAIQDKLLASLIAFFLPNCLFSVASIGIKLARAPKQAAPAESDLLRKIRKRSLSYFAFAACAMGVVQVDFFVMSQLLGAGEIAAYSVVSKVYLFVFYLFSAVLTALWPLFAEAATLKAWPQLQAMLRRTLMLGIGFGLLSGVALFVCMDWILALLAPELGLTAPAGLLALFGVYNLVRIWTDTFATVLQSANDYKPLVMTVPFQALASAGLQTLLVPVLGIQGVVIGLVASFLLTVSWVLPIRTFSMFTKTVHA
jgi:O-antigen/teichoic acid export membrane protein